MNEQFILSFHTPLIFVPENHAPSRSESDRLPRGVQLRVLVQEHRQLLHHGSHPPVLPGLLEHQHRAPHETALGLLIPDLLQQQQQRQPAVDEGTVRDDRKPRCLKQQLPPGLEDGGGEEGQDLVCHHLCLLCL